MVLRYSLNPSKHILRIQNRFHNMNTYEAAKLLDVTLRRNFIFTLSKSYSNPTGMPGSGAGKGGGAGGSVRESGGGLGQYGAAQEEQFFFNKQREQLEKMKKKMKEGKDGLSQKEEK